MWGSVQGLGQGKSQGLGLLGWGMVVSGLGALVGTMVSAELCMAQEWGAAAGFLNGAAWVCSMVWRFTGRS